MNDTLLRKRGVQERLRCDGATARRVEKRFVTVERLVEAVESGRELTEYDGIGPATADAIEKWWNNRFEREAAIGDSTLERTSANSATIHLHTSWDDVIGSPEVTADGE